MVAQSVTNQEIARYWQQRHMVEEDHLVAAIKAAARLRARNFSEDDYLRFQDSLREAEDGGGGDKVYGGRYRNKAAERRVGVKDWWTKSKYAYLNQPAVKSDHHHRFKPSHLHLPQHLLLISN